MTDQDLTEGHVAQGQLAMGRATALAPIYRRWVQRSFPPPAGAVPVARVEFYEAGPMTVAHLCAATPRAAVPVADGGRLEVVLALYDRNVAQKPGPWFILCYRQYDREVPVPADAHRTIDFVTPVSLPLQVPDITFNSVVIQLEDPGAKDAPPAATIITEGR